MSHAPAPARPTGTLPLRVVGYAVSAAVVLGLALLLVPDLLGLDVRTPFAQIVAFRPAVLAVTTAVLAVPLAVLLLTRRALPLAVGVLAVLLLAASTLPARAIAGSAGDGPALTVLAVNVYEGGADVADVAALIAAEQPDLVSIPEAGPRFRERLAPLVEPLGYRSYGSTDSGPDVSGVSALARTRLGELTATVDGGTSEASVVLTGGALGALRFVAFHSAAPTPGRVPQWAADQAHVATWCAGPTPAVVAGDFNASLDHSPFRAGTAGCGDAAEQAGAGLVGTWPSAAPRLLGTQIDHVVATDGITAESFTVHDVTGSDHRAVVTRLRLPL
ncbi:endonuclease/exonuclease/phosphatase family protein [Pseudonocardia abyssalis]|uniref:Endonuclease/exonuclease/phosphatase family protein n=1 Tax=Pseudonocardia abyssalis TaxID=2792008 RepID=A0ABS6UXF9_9PSEU|nr:endonuclease/exonuclease/phosphatase family protein [Pseudonocardia abyssalis]MBW0118424.1 endonuclease/exonuclease/phosphatase family protein [Pseudonocardia abyssalis]MBW0136969.1 endonuclease/exonuclease/phosphatase family protein [Pseudonocardia abyssalis]